MRLNPVAMLPRGLSVVIAALAIGLLPVAAAVGAQRASAGDRADRGRLADRDSRRASKSPRRECRRARASRQNRGGRAPRRRCGEKPASRSTLQVGVLEGESPLQPSSRASEQAPPLAAPPSRPAQSEAPAGPESPTPETPADPEPPAPEPPAEPEVPEPPAESFRFFSPSSIWNTPVPAGAPLDPDSTTIVGAFDALVDSELQAKTGPSINTTEFSVPIYAVPEDQPTVEVGLTSDYAAPALRSAWSAVPLPPDALPSRGNDRHLVLWQPSTDRLWEFWELAHEADGWHAGWGGAMLHASSNPGVYGADAWPGATRFWGASASSLSIAGGLITFEDLEHGKIDHALSMSIPNVRAGVYSSPAQRGDGKSADPLSLPEGAHLRLDPALDLSSLHLPRPTLILARAAQRYGLFVRDGARNVTFQAQDPTSVGSDPYRDPGGFWEGSYPRRILSYFPWDRLQLLKMELFPNPGS
jgi:hypothetical protein